MRYQPLSLSVSKDSNLQPSPMMRGLMKTHSEGYLSSGAASNYRNPVTRLTGRIIGVTAARRATSNLNRRIREIYLARVIPAGANLPEGGFDIPWKGDLRTRGDPAIIRGCRFIRGIWQAGRISITWPKLVSRVVARSLPPRRSPRTPSVPRVPFLRPSVIQPGQRKISLF